MKCQRVVDILSETFVDNEERKALLDVARHMKCSRRTRSGSTIRCEHPSFPYGCIDGSEEAVCIHILTLHGIPQDRWPLELRTDDARFTTDGRGLLTLAFAAEYLESRC
jgi:hypothetical protein